jgi:Tfp pilus assembly protein PilP
MNKSKILFVAGFLSFMLIAFMVDVRHRLSLIWIERQHLQFLREKTTLDQALLGAEAEISEKIARFLPVKKQYFHVGEDRSSIVFRIFSLAKLTNTEVKSMKPHEVKRMGGRDRQVIELTLQAPLPQLSAFFYEIKHRQLPFVFTRINLQYDNDKEWKMTGRMTAFLKKSTMNDFRFDDRAPADTHRLTEFSIHQLHYAGEIRSGHRQWAFIRLPNTRILPVQIGAIVGVEHLAIIEITEQKIILKSLQEIMK